MTEQSNSLSKMRDDIRFESILTNIEQFVSTIEKCLDDHHRKPDYKMTAKKCDAMMKLAEKMRAWVAAHESIVDKEAMVRFNGQTQKLIVLSLTVEALCVIHNLK